MRYIVITCFIVLSNLFGHPHTFIDVYPTMVEKDGYVKQLNMRWLIDDMTSSMLIMEFDQNGNGKIDPNENTYIKDNYFNSLKDYGYYTDLPCEYTISDFQANIIQNRIEYNFSIIPTKKIKVKNFQIKFYDEDFFVAMQLKEEFISQKIPHIVKELDGDWFFGYILIYK